MSELSKTDKTVNSEAMLWKILQIVLWLIGAFIVWALFFKPALGIHLFWNVLIPVAPALLVFGVSIWRNVCPLSSTSLLPRKLGWSKRFKPSIKHTGKLNLIAVALLFLIVPLRHVWFDTSGPLTGLFLVLASVFAFGLGFIYDWKSAWCSGLCPVHPVEKLYAMNNKLRLQNGHCTQCARCVTPCPDSTPKTHPFSATKTDNHLYAGILMVAAFPGFVMGWFYVPDNSSLASLSDWLIVYGIPFGGATISTSLYFILRRVIDEYYLVAYFAATAVSVYYWFRIPALFGYGLFPGDGMLVDLSPVLPAWFFTLIAALLDILFFWFIAFREEKKTNWLIRPEYEPKQ